MKILIIGSKGFIGSHAYSYFSDIAQTWECDVHSNYGSKNYIRFLPETNFFSDLFQSQSFDFCINCSGAASVQDSILKPEGDYNLNTLNVFRILESIRKHQPNCRFINLSSAAVYGNPKTLPIKESQYANPISPYGFHKLQAEILCREFSSLYGLKTCSLRIFSAFGSGLRKQLFWDLNEKLKSKTPIKLFGSGNETRDFIHVSDIIQLIHLIIQKDKFDNDIYNVANGEKIKISEAVRLFYEISDCKIEWKFIGHEIEGYPTEWQADIQKIKSLGYKKTIEI